MIETQPGDGAFEVPVTTWLLLRFEASAPSLEAHRFAFECDGSAVDVTTDRVMEDLWVINPVGTLPPSADCSLTWQDGAGARSASFTTTAYEPVELTYDRTEPGLPLPFPDDSFLVDDAGTATGHRVEIPLPSGLSGDGRRAGEAVIAAAGSPDGFSPAGFIAVALPGAMDLSALPMTLAESLDPLASVGLFDIDLASPTYGQRVAFELTLRVQDDDGSPHHTLELWPGAPLRANGRYALAITNRAQLAPERPLASSPFFRRALGEAAPDDALEVDRTRRYLSEVVDFLENHAVPRIPRDDLVLALRISTRSNRETIADMLAIAGLDVAETFHAPGSNVAIAVESGRTVYFVVDGFWLAQRGAYEILVRELPRN